MDSRTRAGYLAVQFERLVESRDRHSLTLNAPPATFILTPYDNVVTCICELRHESDEAVKALRRRGAVDCTFMISRKLAPREFGAWLDRVLVEDLGADPEVEVEIERLELQAAAS